MVQTDPTPTSDEYLKSLIKPPDKIGYFFIQEGIESLCFKGKAHLLELRDQVEQWGYSDGKELRWNQLAEESVWKANRTGDLNALKLVLSKFEEKRSAGESLLFRLSTWTTEDYPSNLSDAMIAFKS